MMNHTIYSDADAAYLASKIAADLKQVQIFYNEPSDHWIDKFSEEITILLANGCIHSVKYGFVADNKWIMVLEYSVTGSGWSMQDERSGRVPPNVDTSDAHWHSFLRYGKRWRELDPAQRQQISDSLPFERETGEDPSTLSVNQKPTKTYSQNNATLRRQIMTTTQ